MIHFIVVLSLFRYQAMKLQEKLPRSEKTSKIVMLGILSEWVGSVHPVMIVNGVTRVKRICVFKIVVRHALVLKEDFLTSGEEIVDFVLKFQKNSHHNMLDRLCVVE